MTRLVSQATLIPSRMPLIVASSHVRVGARLMTFLRKYSEFSTDGELRTLFLYPKDKINSKREEMEITQEQVD